MNNIRAKYWISRLIVAIKETKKRCLECKNDSALQDIPKMGKLLPPLLWSRSIKTNGRYGKNIVTVGEPLSKICSLIMEHT